MFFGDRGFFPSGSTSGFRGISGILRERDGEFLEINAVFWGEFFPNGFFRVQGSGDRGWGAAHDAVYMFIYVPAAFFKNKFS